MNKQIIDEAAAWWVELSTGEADQASKEAFDRWLRQSPDHVRAYLELLPFWNDGAFAPPGDTTSAEELIASALAADNLVNLKDEAASHAMRQGASTADHDAALERRAPFAMSPLAKAASLLLFIASGVLTAWLFMRDATTYVAAVGERRSITLSDGSEIELNTRSRIRVRFSEQRRDVDLLAGQALFRVAKDVDRPFTVRSDAVQVRAVGTEFDVYRRAEGTIVTVVEGKVIVGGAGDSVPAPSAGGAAPRVGTGANGDRSHAVLLAAGEQLLAKDLATTLVPVKANLVVATAWTQGRLIFEAAPLREVAAEFNRYNERKIIVDAALDEFLVNGSFRSGNPASLLIFLSEQPGITVHETASAVRIARE